MARKIISKKHTISELNAINASETHGELTNELLVASIKDSAGGSISASKGALVKSSELGKWLDKVRIDTKNPFIGKSYMVRASEYEREDKMLAPGKVNDMNSELDAELTEGTEAYDPNSAKSPMAEERESIRDDGGAANKMIDHCIVSNLTRKLSGRSDDEIMKLAHEELRNHHDDYEYVTKIDITKSIEKTRYDQLALTNTKMITSND